MRKNKLYTVNKWNKPIFATNIDRTYQNIFAGGGGLGFFSSGGSGDSDFNSLMGLASQMNSQGQQDNSMPNFNTSYGLDTSSNNFWQQGDLGWNQIQANNQVNLANSTFGQNAGFNINSSALAGQSGPQVSQSSLPSMGSSISQNAISELKDKAPGQMADLKEKMQTSSNKKVQLGEVGNALKGVGLSLADNIGKSDKFKRGLWDRVDPVHYLAGGRESAVGNAMGDAGVSVFKAGAQSGNGYMMIAGAGLKVLGGLTNAAFGYKVDKERLNAMNAGIDSLKAFNSNASTFDDVKGPNAIVDNTEGLYEGGWFTGNGAAKKNQKMKDKVLAAESWANRSVENNIENISDTQMDTMLANYAAYGGPLGRTVNPADYNNLSDYLLARSKINTDNQYALGGDIQTNGGDFTDGLEHIDAGGSHEENPNDGVQVGISKENGNPNLVEEGETIFDDYVFSNRIEIDDITKERFHIAKKRSMTFADLSKKLEKESLERPNDPISQAGLRKQMHDLQEEQERQKKEMQERETEENFEKLPPEQQQMIMEQLALEEEQAKQQQMQEQQGEEPQENSQEESPTEQQISNEELPQEEQPSEEQMLQQQQPELQEENEVQLNANGGNMNRFDEGGDLKKNIYGLLKNIYTDSDFAAWAKENKIDPSKIDWSKALKDPILMAAITRANPAAAHSLKNGYDFGKYKRPNEDKFNIDWKHGGWGEEDYNAWDGSTDAIWLEAKEKGLVHEGMNSEEIGKALRQTDAYRRGTEWLQKSDANRLKYLQSILLSEDAPQAAKDYASKFADEKGWKKDAKTDYQTIFEDPNGTGVRNTHPGTYWKTAAPMLIADNNKNFVIDDKGNVEEIYGDVPKEWTLTNSTKWQDENNNYNYNYYTRPATKEGEKKVGDTDFYEDENGRFKWVPKHKSTFERMAGLMGAPTALTLMAAGVGKPDYKHLDRAETFASEAPTLAHASFIGNYYKPTLLDPNREYNKTIANSRAADRAILNNASPIGTKNAGIVANNYNTITGIGDADIKGIDYNNTQKLKEAEFNRGTDQYNATAATDISKTNADIINRNRQFRSQLAMEAAKERMDSEASWYRGMYGTLNNAFKGLSDIGKENAQYNMIADMAGDGIFGTMTGKQFTGSGMFEKQYVDENGNPIKKPKKVISAYGGKIRRKKKGLTF